MVCYYDTSFLLTAVLEQSPPQAMVQLWNDADERVSSFLLRLECVVGLTRAALRQGVEPADRWFTDRQELLDEYLSSVHLVSVDEAIERVLRQETGLAHCRSLDAIHLATALYVAPNLDVPLTVCTFDQRMASVAVAHGLAVWPDGQIPNKAP